jgi:AraC family transcriptional activator of pobA
MPAQIKLKHPLTANAANAANAANTPVPVPVFKLYGETEHWPTPDLLHCESIAERSRLHNWQIKPHQHNGLFQILFLREGSAEIELDGSDLMLEAGSILLIPQMCIHGFHFGPDARGHVVMVAYPLLHKLVQQAAGGLLALTGPVIHHLGHSASEDYLSASFAALDQEYKSSAPGRQLLLENLLAVILLFLGRRDSSQNGMPFTEQRRGNQHYSKFAQLLELHFAAHQALDWYASQLHISPPHLNLLCRQVVGKTALTLVHERLILEAKRNLVYSSMSIAQVADRLGFVDPAYFTRFFKREVGVSPLHFRRSAGT